MATTRRIFLLAGTSAIALAAAPAAHALTTDQAKQLIKVTVDRVRRLLNSPVGSAGRAPALKKIMEAQANMALIGRYCAGRAWREMSGSQRGKYQNAFSHYVSVIYARRFDEFGDKPKIKIGRALDAGRKGMLIQSPMVLGDGRRVMVEWLVSDRGGKVEIIDLLIEGISMAATQREEIGAMIDRRGGNIDKLIADLAATS